MTTLRELAYQIEANTSGLNKAFPALEKLVGTLERLDKSVQTFNTRVASGVDKAGTAFEKQGKNIDKTAKQITAALNRQQAGIISAQQKVISLNRAIQSSGADTKLIAANTRAYQQLEQTLKKTDITAAELTLAKAKFNATLSETKRSLMEYNSAQRNAQKAQGAAEASILKQGNAVERVRIQYENLRHALEAKGAGAKILGDIDSTFKDFEKSMSGGVLSAEKFSEATNKLNREFAKVKRSEGFAKGLRAGVSELASSAQIALGPLSGVASRLTALTSLAGATNIAVAGVVGIVIALGTALAKSVLDGARFEAQMARVNSILETTGNKALISSRNVELVVRRISAATSASQTEVREAASGLLLITGMNEELLESSLAAAQGLAIVGGGNIQSAFRNLAQVLQEPSQGLQTLTQYGVKFTHAQREQIIMLEEAGKKTEAIAAIMQKLEPHIKAATSETNTLSGAYRRFLNDLTNISQDFSNNIGLIDKLKNTLDGLSKLASDAALGFTILVNVFDALADKLGPVADGLGYIYDNLSPLTNALSALGVGFGHLMTDVVGWSTIAKKTGNDSFSLQAHVVDLYNTMQSAGGTPEQLEKFNAGLKAVVAEMKKVEGTNIAPNVDVADLAKALDSLGTGNIDAAIASLGKYTTSVKTAEAATQEQANALDYSMSIFSKLKEEHLGLIKEQELLAARTTALNDHWDNMKAGLMATGKSAEQAEAILNRLRTEVELNTSSINKHVNTMQRANATAQQDIAITEATGNTKRRLQLEQRILNELWASGVITASNYNDALKELRTMGLDPLAEAIARAAAEAEKADYAKNVASMTKALEDQLAIAEVAGSVATESARKQALALALATKMQEMLNAGIAQGSEEWNKMLSIVNQIAAIEFAADQDKNLKAMNNELKLAQASLGLVHASMLEQATAMAVINEMIAMENEGVAQGSELWNQRLGIVKQLVNIDFSKQHEEAVKSMQQQMVMQDRMLGVMFMSERTRSRGIALIEKEMELTQKYGSLMDERAAKEMNLFKQLQAREEIIKDWQEVARVIDNTFQTLEDSIVEFLKTGEFEWRKFASAVLEDIFRTTFKMVVSNPLQDLLGGLLGGAAQTAGLGGGAGAGFTPMMDVQAGVVNVNGAVAGGGGMMDMLGGGGGAATGGGGLGGSVGGMVGGGGAGNSIVNQIVAPVQQASEQVSNSLVDLGNGLTMTSDAFTRKMGLVTQEASKIGDYASNGAAAIQSAGGNLAKSVNGVSGSVSGLRGSITDMQGTVGSMSSSLNDLTNKVTPLTREITPGLGLANLTKNTMAEFEGSAGKITKAFQGKIRGMDVSPDFMSKLESALGRTEDGLGAVITSGGQMRLQDAIEAGAKKIGSKWFLNGKAVRTGSTRHDVGADGFAQTADVVLTRGGKQVLPGQDPQLYADFFQNSGAEGFTGMGHYNWGAHIGGGSKVGWGPSTTSADLNPFFGSAMQKGWAGQGTSGGSAFQLPQSMSTLPSANPMGMGGGASPFGSVGAGGMVSGAGGMGGMAGGMGGDITGQLRGSLDGLSQSVTTTTSSLTKLGEDLPSLTTNLTSGLDKAASSATELADGGLRRTIGGMDRLATETVTQSVAAQAQSAVSTQKMATDTTVASVGVQTLGNAAVTAAAQMQMSGAIGGIAGVFHDGGIAGSASSFRATSGSWAGAPRLHGGLHSNEFKAILKRGEGVFTEDQMEVLGNAVGRGKGQSSEEGSQGGGGMRRGGAVTVNLNGVKDFDSFRKSQAQLNAGMSSAFRQADQRQH